MIKRDTTNKDLRLFVGYKDKTKLPLSGVVQLIGDKSEVHTFILYSLKKTVS